MIFVGINFGALACVDNVFQSKQTDLLGAHAVGQQQLQDRVVPPSQSRGAIGSLEQTLRLFPAGSAR